MTLFISKTGRKSQLAHPWWNNDSLSNTTVNKHPNTAIQTQDYSSNIILKSTEDSLAMLKTKIFLSESLKTTKGIDHTVITGSAATTAVPELHEIMLNIQPLGWISISGGKKNETH